MSRALPRFNARLAILLVLLLQAILNFIAFWYAQPFIVDWAFLELAQFYFENQIYGSKLIIRIAGFDLTYIFTVPASELKQYYSRFYWVLYLVGLGIRYGVPLIIASLIAVWIKRKSEPLRFMKNFSSFHLGVYFLVSLILQVIVYFVLTKHNYQPVEYQIQLARIFLGMNLLTIGTYLFYNRVEVFKQIQQFMFEPVLPYALALTRIIFFSYSIFLYLIIFRIGHGSNLGDLEKVGLPGIGWLIEVIPVNSQIYEWFCYAGAILCVLIVIGYKTRVFLLLNAVVVFYVVATPNFFGKLWHEQLVIWISWILAFSPCSDVLSLDALRNKPTKVIAKPVYSFHLKMIWLHFGLIYFFAGFFKLWASGFDWALSDSMVHLVQIEWFEHYDQPSSWRVDKIPTLLKVGGLGVILFEMMYILMLFKKRLKWMSILGGLTMHNFLGKVMYISFFSLLQVFYLVFIPWNWILLKLGMVKTATETTVARPKLSSIAILIPTLMFSLNTVCGVFKINSYPFSIYPVYTDIVGENVRYFDYRIKDVGFEHINFREEGEAHNFRWEDFSRHEYHLIREWEAGKGLDSLGVRTMWKRWKLNVPSLSSIDSVNVYVVERPLNPDSSHLRLSEEYLMTIYPANQD